MRLPLTPAARLEVHTVTSTGAAGTISLDQPPVITSADVVSVGPDDSNNSYSIAVELTPAGAAKMSAATTPATGQQLGIVLNGKPIGVPAVHATLSDRFIISVWTQAAERDLVLQSLTR
jgi:preprotein translocase subunit SecD